MPEHELPKTYKPAEHEDRAWRAWLDSGAFHADPARVLRGEARPYCIVIPPPNVTDRLHLGHGLNNTLQDILARAHRMRGFETLWMPGTDHAGIATQAVVERRVLKDEGKRRHDFAREDFVAKIQAFKDEYEATITAQLQKMGCSCDWDRQRFTMDEVCAAAVREAFFRLFRDGLIYRGKRLVNWDPALQTAVADDECFDEEIDAHFYYLRYPLVHAHGSPTAEERRQHKEPQDAVPVTWDELLARGYPGADEHPADDQAWITVATTRPETYLGDTAVAVNPNDPRAHAIRGLSVELPLVGRVIPIIEDDYVVLPKHLARNDDEANDPKAQFATGFLKVTPAHDPNDYEIGQRHQLPMINVFAPDATISDKHGWSDVRDAHLFLGLSREKARKRVIEEFKARTVGNRSLLEEVKPYRHSVKHSDRSKSVIEPYLSDQWYVRVTDPRLASAANEALTPEQRTSERRDQPAKTPAPADTGTSLRFYPSRYAKTYEQWHDNIRDWCISRQLWWGHRIPVWSAPIEAEDRLAELSANADLAVQRTAGAIHVCLRPGATELESRLESLGFARDPDVLDTWFSSALWPMSTMGWPDPEAAARIENDPSLRELLKAFNPTTTLCTAREIITLWVSRMVMFNRYFMGDGQGRGPAPFRNVFIHAIVQDGEGRKMSKSLGNGVDPLDIIASHGSDAMRFTLCKMSTQTQDVRMPVVKGPDGRNTSPKFDEGRNFCNKLWNAARFALAQLSSPADAKPPAGGPALIDRWMLSRLHAAIGACDAALADFEFANYAQSVYDLLWRDFCDWYLEGIKPTVAADPRQQSVLAHALEVVVRLLHPITPFVTEAIWERVREVRTLPIAGLTLAPSRKGGTLCTAGWPIADPTLHDPDAEASFERLRGLITAVREARASLNVPPKRKILLHAPEEARRWMAAAPGLVESLAGLERVEAIPASKPAGSAEVRFESLAMLISNLADAVDADAEKARLNKLIADLDKSITTLEGRLANPGYADRAPPHMVQQTRDQLAKAIAERDAARAALAGLG